MKIDGRIVEEDVKNFVSSKHKNNNEVKKGKQDKDQK